MSTIRKGFGGCTMHPEPKRECKWRLVRVAEDNTANNPYTNEDSKQWYFWKVQFNEINNFLWFEFLTDWITTDDCFGDEDFANDYFRKIIASNDTRLKEQKNIITAIA